MRRRFLTKIHRFVLAATLCCFGAIPASADELLVFAAASLRGALDDVAAAWTGDVAVSYAGSSALARQIGFGAPADVFFSANPAWMDSLEEEGLIRSDTRAEILGNELVLVGPAPAGSVALDEASLDARLGDDRIAIPIPGAVPAGIYGQAAFETLGLWQAIGPRAVETDNVRTALALAARGEVPLAVVYATDALAEPQVDIVARFPEDSHPPIRYPAAALTTSTQPETAAAFVAFLTSAAAQEIFAAHGFRAP